MINIEKVTKRKTGNISINYIEDGEQKCLIASPFEILMWYAAQKSVQRTVEHKEDCAINVGMLGECDCGAED